jgi:hypothetical protein
MEKKDEIKKSAITNEMSNEKVVMHELNEKDLGQVTGGDINFCPKKNLNFNCKTDGLLNACIMMD